MRGLFLKSLVVIAVSVIGSIVGMILILNAFEASPVLLKLEEDRRQVALDLTEAVLTDEGPEAAMRFAEVSERARPLGLRLTQLGVGDCAEGAGPYEQLVDRAGGCYRLSTEPPAPFVSYRFAPIMLGLAVLASTVLAAALLARNLVNPVIQLRDGLRALADGRFDVRIAAALAHRKDEISTLAGDFDRTAVRLEEHHEAQRRLFHDVSHELRSPLSRLQAATGILRKSPARLGTMLDRMDREVERLDELVGEVLTLARLSERVDAPLQTQVLDLIDLLNAILADAAFEAAERRVTVTTDLPGSFLAEVEGELVYRSLENVIRNAVKHTAEGTSVTVECAEVGGRLSISVTDEGPGVRPEDLETIFYPFARGSGAPQRGGYGLGLAIARRAIEHHGGRVRAELPPSGGLRVVLDLPKQPGKAG
ncbi:ATP-binding protein [Vannielia litorea]|uniref:HAMP domain-containing sensor histidine kinase n=1 Tax=Vannielia litorea TaxID=1217970 RepID=UPI001C98A11D|nr:ATP-binding protein [Vannielia litorea]MBY6049023.1 HAMP domain-containing protein [Vannielia litorea]MBY6076437.1 HAMP domain-containing protein [Vannielia litorea]